MKDIEQNTALPLFESDIYKGNIPEDSKDYNYSESTSTKVEEKPPMPEESVPTGKIYTGLMALKSTQTPK